MNKEVMSFNRDSLKLADFQTELSQNRYVVNSASDGYINYLSELAKELNGYIKSLKKRNPDNSSDYDSSRDQCSRWEAQLKEVNQALEIMTGDESIDIIDRLGETNDHVLWLEAVEVYQEKIKIYEGALKSSPNLPEHLIIQYKIAIAQLKDRIKKLEDILEQYENTLQVLGRGALEETSITKPPPNMVSV